MDTTSLIAMVGGAPLSALIAYLLGLHYRREVGVALAFGVCVVFALAVTVLTNTLVTKEPHGALALVRLLIENCFIVLGVAYTTYEHILRPTGVAARLNAAGPQVAATPPSEAPPAP